MGERFAGQRPMGRREGETKEEQLDEKTQGEGGRVDYTFDGRQGEVNWGPRKKKEEEREVGAVNGRDWRADQL